MKTCRTCQQDKDAEEDFYSGRRTCKSCLSNQRKKKYLKQREEICAKQREYRLNNHESVLAKKKAEYHRNKKTYKRWQKNNPLKVRFYAMCQGARNKNRSIPFSFNEWKERFFDHPCFYCGGESNGGIDRVDNDRGYEEGNCVPCCRLCNMIKSNMTLKACAEHLGKMLDSVRSIVKNGDGDADM